MFKKKELESVNKPTGKPMEVYHHAELLATNDPRVRMKEIRQEVADIITENPPHTSVNMTVLSELPKNMEDGKRVIIALQDMLSDSKERHSKATKIIQQGMYAIAGYAEDNASMSNTIELVAECNNKAVDRCIELESQNKSMGEEITQLRSEYDALLATIKILSK